MKTMSARKVNNSFGVMVNTAHAEPVLIEQLGRDVVVVSVKEHERLSAQSRSADGRETRTGGRRKVANEACACVKFDRSPRPTASKQEAVRWRT